MHFTPAFRKPSRPRIDLKFLGSTSRVLIFRAGQTHRLGFLSRSFGYYFDIDQHWEVVLERNNVNPGICELVEVFFWHSAHANFKQCIDHFDNEVIKYLIYFELLQMVSHALRALEHRYTKYTEHRAVWISNARILHIRAWTILDLCQKNRESHEPLKVSLRQDPDPVGAA